MIAIDVNQARFLQTKLGRPSDIDTFLIFYVPLGRVAVIYGPFYARSIHDPFYNK